MEEKHKKEIEKIIRDMKCGKDFQCHKSGFAELCKVKLEAGGELVSCEDSNCNKHCNFALPFGFTKIYCTCPLRKYLAQKLHI